MHRRIVTLAAAFLALLAPALVRAADAPSDAYATFVTGAEVQRGLFTILRKSGHVYIDVGRDQLDKDYLETIVPGNGLGGNFVVWGNTDHLPAMLVRFERAGEGVAIVWPNTSFVAPNSEAGQLSVRQNFPQSVTGVGKIVAENGSHVVFDASPLFDDALNFSKIINGSLNTEGSSTYRLDSGRTYFGATKAFPENVVIDVNQLWANEAAHTAPDTAPDSRSIQMRIVYNFAQLPHDAYVPRYADDRVGIYDDISMDFSSAHDTAPDRYLRYLVRWNFAPADPGKPSAATHPMVFYMSKTIPPAYRKAIGDAVLRWNDAFEKIGILDAIQVKPQPDDPSWDPDDIRYSVLRWVTEQQPSFGADSQTLFDPRTGEEFRTGVLISAESAQGAAGEWRNVVDPVRYGRDTDPVPAQFVYDSLQAEIMHETGHNLGMQHNFIGSMAYTAKQLQDPVFTAKYGIASTVMEYAPINIWPKPYGQGSYYQTVLGPYDYYAMKFAYAHIPGANTPEQELPTLRRWASAWSQPFYRYGSDEDVSWGDGHAADPRVEQGDLTNDPLSWTRVQLRMNRALMDAQARRMPHAGNAYEDASNAFGRAFFGYLGKASAVSHYIGGQYLSRAHRGDPGAEAPIVPVPRATQANAFAILDEYLFSDKHLTFSPTVLNRLGYSEWSGYGYVGWEGYGNLPVWAYSPPQRHDYPIVEDIGRSQTRVIDQMFSAPVLSRIQDNPLEATGPTLTTGDLFAWMHRSIFHELGERTTVSLLRRNLQTIYTTKLIQLANAPERGTPTDARALARQELTRIHDQAANRAHAGNSDALTQAHLLELAHLTESALKP